MPIGRDQLSDENIDRKSKKSIRTQTDQPWEPKSSLDCRDSRKTLDPSNFVAPLAVREAGLLPMVISHCARRKPSAGTDVQALRLELREAPALSQISPSGAVRR